MVDQNVYIEAQDATADYYFPACDVYNDFNKNLSELPIPQGEISLDMLFATETFRIVGRWRDDDAIEFDGMKAFARWIQFKTYNKNQKIVYLFHWSSHGYEENSVYVKLMESHIIRYSGKHGTLDYNILLRVITVAAS